jgi:hypothetical protein
MFTVATTFTSISHFSLSLVVVALALSSSLSPSTFFFIPMATTRRGGPPRGRRQARDGTTDADDALEVKELRSKHSKNLATLKELFAGWGDEDLLFAIQEAGGDLDTTIDRITSGPSLCVSLASSSLSLTSHFDPLAPGRAEQWGSVKSRKAKKDAPSSGAQITSTSSVPRGSFGRGRGSGAFPFHPPSSEPANQHALSRFFSLPFHQRVVREAVEAAGQGAVAQVEAAFFSMATVVVQLLLPQTAH